MRNTLIAIAGPACAGKTALARRLVRRGCARVVTSTTRPARPGEIHGRDHRFRSAFAFVALRLGGRLLEHARFGGHTYGVERCALDEAWAHSDIAVAVVTPGGLDPLARWCAAHERRFVSVFVSADPNVLRKRLRRQRPDATVRRALLREQFAQWLTPVPYDLVLPGPRPESAAERVFALAVNGRRAADPSRPQDPP